MQDTMGGQEGYLLLVGMGADWEVFLELFKGNFKEWIGIGKRKESVQDKEKS